MAQPVRMANRSAPLDPSSSGSLIGGALAESNMAAPMENNMAAGNSTVTIYSHRAASPHRTITPGTEIQEIIQDPAEILPPMGASLVDNVSEKDFISSAPVCQKDLGFAMPRPHRSTSLTTTRIPVLKHKFKRRVTTIYDTSNPKNWTLEQLRVGLADKGIQTPSNIRKQIALQLFLINASNECAARDHLDPAGVITDGIDDTYDQPSDFQLPQADYPTTTSRNQRQRGNILSANQDSSQPPMAINTGPALAESGTNNDMNTISWLKSKMHQQQQQIQQMQHQISDLKSASATKVQQTVSAVPQFSVDNNVFEPQVHMHQQHLTDMQNYDIDFSRPTPAYQEINPNSGIDVSYSSLCVNGDCVDRGNGFDCLCYPGWTGTLCDMVMAGKDSCISERGRAYKCVRCDKNNFTAARNRVINHLYMAHLPIEAAPFHCSLCRYRCMKEKDFFRHPSFYALHIQKAGILKNTGALKNIEEYKVSASTIYQFNHLDLICLSKQESREVWEQRRLSNNLSVQPHPSNSNTEVCSPLKMCSSIISQENDLKSPELIIPEIDVDVDAEDILPKLLGKTASQLNNDTDFPGINTPLMEKDTIAYGQDSTPTPVMCVPVPLYEPITPVTIAPSSPADSNLSKSSSSSSSNSSSSSSSCSSSRDEHHGCQMTEVLSILEGLQDSLKSLVEISKENHKERRETNHLLHDIHDLLRHPVRTSFHNKRPTPYSRKPFDRHR